MRPARLRCTGSAATAPRSAPARARPWRCVAAAMRRRSGSSAGADAAAGAEASPAAATAAAAAPAARAALRVSAAPAARARGASGRPRLPPQLQSLLPPAASPLPPPPPAQPARYVLVICTAALSGAGARSALAAATQQLAGCAASSASTPLHRTGWPEQLLPHPRLLWRMLGLPPAEAQPPAQPAWLSAHAAHAALLGVASRCAAAAPEAAAAAPPGGDVAAAVAAVPRGALADALWLCDDAACASDAAVAVAAALLQARDAHGERLAVTLLSLQGEGDEAEAAHARVLAGALHARLVPVRLPAPAAAAQPIASPQPEAPSPTAAGGRPVPLPPPPPTLPLLLDAAVLWRGALVFPDPRRRHAGGEAAPERPLRGLAALALPLTAVLPGADEPLHGAAAAGGVRYAGMQLCADEPPLLGAARCALVLHLYGASIATSTHLTRPPNIFPSA